MLMLVVKKSGVCAEMNGVIWYLVYSSIAFHIYMWTVLPEFVYNDIWKWDLFMIAILTPVFLIARK